MSAKRETATDGAGAPEPGGFAALNALARIPGGIGAALDDLRTIADGMRILPELGRILEAIERRTDSLDEEVTRMRKEVERVSAEVAELGDRLEPHLVEMKRSLQPLKRMTGRVGRATRRREPGESSADEA